MNGLQTAVALVVVILFFLSCKEQKKEATIENTEKEPVELSTLLVYNDSIGNVERATVLIKSKIDSVYNEMLLDALSSDNKHLKTLVIDSKEAHANLIETNSAIYRQSFGNATGGGSFAALYEYYYLCKYFEEIRLLQRDLRAAVHDQ